MASTLDFDAAAAAQIETIYSTPDIAATRVAVFRAAQPRPGERALDLGCGPGFLTRDLALAVGAGGRVVAADLSEPMLAMTQSRCAGLAQVTTRQADAVSLGEADGAFDLACVLQVYAYVRELDTALGELRRVLKPGGRGIILDTDFSGVVWQSQDRARMRRMLEAYDAHVAWPDLPRILPARLRAAGLTLERCELVPILTLDYHPNTYVHGIARFIHRFVTTQAGIGKAEADAWLAEFDQLQRERAFLFAINRFLFVVRKE